MYRSFLQNNRLLWAFLLALGLGVGVQAQSFVNTAHVVDSAGGASESASYSNISAISSDTVFFGKLYTLLDWHIADPVDAAERVRNDLVYNRLPEEQKPVCGSSRVGGGDLRQYDERAVCLEQANN